MKSPASQCLRLLALFCLLGAPSGARAFYDSNLGRWINRDPIQEQDGPNLFAMVSNSPIGSIDPYGEHITIPMPRWPIPRPNSNPKVDPVTTVVAVRIFVAICATKVGEKLLRGFRRSKECEEEWADARLRCARALSRPNPDPVYTQGGGSIEDCARGFVSEACGVNPTGRPNPKPRKQWKFD